jgi:hypothetical protein
MLRGLKMECDFSLRHYEECLREAKKKEYTILPLKEYKRDGEFDKTLYLRHDVDISILLAKQMFDVEQKIGVDSTYFLRLHNYNLFSLEGYYFIKDLKESKSEIGFHYTEEFARLMNEDPKEMFKRELKVFENIVDEKVYGVCKHLPSKTKAVLTTDFFKELGNISRNQRIDGEKIVCVNGSGRKTNFVFFVIRCGGTKIVQLRIYNSFD